MMRALIAAQVFLLMCAPLPQASYIAVGVGRDAGLALLLLLCLYALSDVVVATTIALGVRRLPLPRPVRRLADGAVARAERVARGRASLAALFAVGFVSLYSAAALAGLRRSRLAPSLAAAVAGDLLQFGGTILLGTALARLIPAPGGEWTFLIALPVLVGGVPAAFVTTRRALSRLARGRPFLFRAAI